MSMVKQRLKRTSIRFMLEIDTYYIAIQYFIWKTTVASMKCMLSTFCAICIFHLYMLLMFTLGSSGNLVPSVTEYFSDMT